MFINGEIVDGCWLPENLTECAKVLAPQIMLLAYLVA